MAGMMDTSDKAEKTKDGEIKETKSKGVPTFAVWVVSKREAFNPEVWLDEKLYIDEERAREAISEYIRDQYFTGKRYREVLACFNQHQETLGRRKFNPSIDMPTHAFLRGLCTEVSDDGNVFLDFGLKKMTL